MKKQSLLFIVVLLFIGIYTGSSQENSSVIAVGKTNSSNSGLKKGEFHVGIQDLRFGFNTGQTSMNIGARFGYMVSDKDMIFVAASYSGITGFDFNNIETSLNYRRYFGTKALKPFAQIGAGHGYVEFPESSYSLTKDKNYFHANAGMGVSYRYKQWSFETGLQLIYNQQSSANVSIAPMVGVSFSF